MSSKLVNELIKSGYSTQGAESAAKQIADMHSDDIRRACAIWLESRQRTPISEGVFSTDLLMNNFGMTYPASLIWLEWYRDDPSNAIMALEMGGGDLS